MLLHVKLGGAFSLAVDVLSHGGVEAFGVSADVADDERVTPPFFQDADVVVVLQGRL